MVAAVQTARLSMRPRLAITMGDPAGIGPEVIVKGLAMAAVRRACLPVVIGSPSVLERACRVASLSFRMDVRSVADSDAMGDRSLRKDTIRVVDPFDGALARFRKGTPTASAGAASVRCIETAVALARRGAVDGIVTAPINKHAMHLAGYQYPGHTEMLAHLTGANDVGMMIVGGPLKILFATTHVAMRALPRALTLPVVLNAIRMADRGLRELFRLRRPRIGVSGFNPHAGEGGLFGQEEQRVIAPAVKRARAAGVRCTGPHPADTLFGKAVQGEFDGVVAMYHDQGLVALKTVAFGQCVNVTVGLPIIRTSVDHGTAYDIVGKGIADPTSFVEAIRLAATLARQRRGATSVA